MAFKRLKLEYKDILKEPNYLYSVEISDKSILEWNFIVIGPQDTLYENGIFNGQIIFPMDYPNSLPKVHFKNDMYHPNVYKNGTVCISILHNGVDQYGYESDNERWSPTHNVNTIMLSIISLLANPNFESPANVDIGIIYKKNYDDYKNKIYKLVSKTQSL